MYLIGEAVCRYSGLRTLESHSWTILSGSHHSHGLQGLRSDNAEPQSDPCVADPLHS